MLSKDGKICRICKSCEYRQVFGGGKPLRDWSNTLCNYNIETDELRETQPTDNHCDYYKPRRRRR